MPALALWCAIGGFLLGVWVRSFAAIGWGASVWCAVCAAGVLAAAYCVRLRASARTLVLLGLFGMAVSCGIARMQVGELRPDPVMEEYVGSQITVEGVVIDEPDVRESSVRVPVRVDSADGQPLPHGARLIAVVPLHTAVSYGDSIRARGVLDTPEAFASGEGRVFDYPKFLAKDGIGYLLSFAEIERVRAGDGNAFKAGAIKLKQTYVQGLARALSEPQAGLAGGITVGDKRGLGEQVSEVFRVVGLTHIIVLSGYNIMVVAEAAARLLARAPNAIRLVLGVSIALFFAAITGFASASSRAAMMASIAMLGRATGRMYLASRALGVVAFGMVLWNPYVLAFDPGFQLSVIATIGLIAFAPHIAARMQFIPAVLGFRDIVAATIGTQVAVLPLLLYQTGGLSFVALPANLLALAVIPLAMLFSAIAGVAGLILGPVAPLAAFPAYVLLLYVIEISKLFASLPFALVSIPAFGVWWLIVVYGLMGFVYWFVQKEAAGREASPQ